MKTYYIIIDSDIDIRLYRVPDITRLQNALDYLACSEIMPISSLTKPLPPIQQMFYDKLTKEKT